MSKSLGTGIDPLEMIDEHGADATRFGLLLMSSTQDVRFSEEKIVMGRGFANKLWNAARFVLLGTEGYPAKRSEASEVDRWIASRFQRCLATVEAAVTVYDFTAAVDALYHFVWDEFCDWYLELVKVRLYGEDEAEKAAAAGNARWMLDQIVRLLHPFLPFVTEEIAERYGAAPLLRQEHPRRDEAQLAPDAEKAIAELQAAVDALRRFRAEAEIPPGKVLDAVFVGDAAGAEGRYAPYLGAFRALARTTVAFTGDPGEDATVVIVPGGRLEVAAAVDRAEEIARLEQQLAKAETEVDRGEAKLGNEKFVSKAPAAVVAKEREKLAGHVAERDGLAARISQLKDG
jgi:valyl-tRNA synthetase